MTTDRSDQARVSFGLRWQRELHQLLQYSNEEHRGKVDSQNGVQFKAFPCGCAPKGPGRGVIYVHTRLASNLSNRNQVPHYRNGLFWLFFNVRQWGGPEVISFQELDRRW